MVMCSSDKGFFLLDALLCVFIVSAVCILCYSIFSLNQRYDEGYLQYQERSNQNYERILNGFNSCESCVSYESD